MFEFGAETSRARFEFLHGFGSALADKQIGCFLFQISNLVSHRERTVHPGPGILTTSAARGARAAARVGQAVSLAVDRFVTVGETIADDNPDIRVDMYEACKEARAAGCAIERLCQVFFFTTSLENIPV